MEIKLAYFWNFAVPQFLICWKFQTLWCASVSALQKPCLLANQAVPNSAGLDRIGNIKIEGRIQQAVPYSLLTVLKQVNKFCCAYVRIEMNSLCRLGNQIMQDEVSETENIRKNLAIERMIVEGCDILLDVNQTFVRQGMSMFNFSVY